MNPVEPHANGGMVWIKEPWPTTEGNEKGEWHAAAACPARNMHTLQYKTNLHYKTLHYRNITPLWEWFKEKNAEWI